MSRQPLDRCQNPRNQSVGGFERFISTRVDLTAVGERARDFVGVDSMRRESSRCIRTERQNDRSTTGRQDRAEPLGVPDLSVAVEGVKRPAADVEDVAVDSASVGDALERRLWTSKIPRRLAVGVGLIPPVLALPVTSPISRPIPESVSKRLGSYCSVGSQREREPRHPPREPE